MPVKKFLNLGKSKLGSVCLCPKIECNVREKQYHRFVWTLLKLMIDRINR